MSDDSSTHPPPLWQHWLAAIAVGVVFLAACLCTWRKWPDALVDFGVQLYIPWRLAHGAVLYRDIAYLTGGPLAQYCDALLFKIFGTSFLALALANLAILVFLLVLLYRSFCRAADALTAAVICLAVVCVFAFEHYTEFGIFNYVTPYSEELYQGLALGIAGVVLLANWIVKDRPHLAFTAGICAGLTLLCKAEASLAFALACAAAIPLYARTHKTAGSFVKSLVLLAAGAFLPIGIFFCYFAFFLGMGSALRAVFWAWVPIVTTNAADSPFFRWCLGLDNPALNLQRMFLYFAGLLGFVILCGIVTRKIGRQQRGAVWISVFAFAAGFASWKFSWGYCGYGLPLVCLGALMMIIVPSDFSVARHSEVFPLLWTIFSIGLLAKLGLFCRIWHYGFALAMPAFVTGLYLLLWLLPNALRIFNVQPGQFRLLVCVALGVGFCSLGRDSLYSYNRKTVPIGDGNDRMLVFDPHEFVPGAELAVAEKWIETNTPANSTLAVIPCGAMLNYLTRRPNPTPWLRWNPTEIAAFGMGRMTQSFERAAPDYVVLIGVNHNAEYGVKFFGDTPAFGRDLTTWMGQNYDPVVGIGHDWTKDSQFGIKILQRRSASPAPPLQEHPRPR